MICTSDLFTGFTKTNKIMSMFVLFFWLLSNFESLAFFRRWRNKPYTKAVKQDVFSQFLKGRTIKVTIFKKKQAILTKTLQQVHIEDFFNKTYGFGKKLWLFRLFDCFLGTKVTTLCG